jgi:hypothetical protein
VILFKKFIPIIFFGGIFIFVVLGIKPPISFTQASFSQILLFFTPLFLFFIFFLNLFFNFFIRSLIISLGLIFILIFKALDLLNFVSILFTTLAIIFLIASFKKPVISNQPKIQNLKLKKQH